MKTKKLKTAITKTAGYGVYERKNSVRYYHEVNSYERLKEKYFNTEKRPNDLKTALVIYIIVACIFFIHIPFSSRFCELIPNSFSTREVLFVLLVAFGISLILSLSFICPIMLIIKIGHFSNLFDSEIRMLKGADNMLHNAYNRLGRLPTIDEMKKESYFKRFSPDAIVFTSSLALYIAIFGYSNNDIILYIIALILTILCVASKLSLIQRLDTKKPDNATMEFVLNAAHKTYNDIEVEEL